MILPKNTHFFKKSCLKIVKKRLKFTTIYRRSLTNILLGNHYISGLSFHSIPPLSSQWRHRWTTGGGDDFFSFSWKVEIWHHNDVTGGQQGVVTLIFFFMESGDMTSQWRHRWTTTGVVTFFFFFMESDRPPLQPIITVGLLNGLYSFVHRLNTFEQQALTRMRVAATLSVDWVYVIGRSL